MADQMISMGIAAHVDCPKCRHKFLPLAEQKERPESPSFVRTFANWSNKFFRTMRGSPDGSAVESRNLCEASSPAIPPLDVLAEYTDVLREKSLFDPFTELLNQRGIQLFARKEESRRRRTPSPIAFILIDIENFAGVNRNFGIPAADAVLLEVSRLLSSCVRDCDVLGRSECGGFESSGDEFLIVAPDTDHAQAEALCKRVRSVVRKNAFRYQGVTIPVSINFGVAVAEGGQKADYDAMGQRAAEALAEAK